MSRNSAASVVVTRARGERSLKLLKSYKKPKQTNRDAYLTPEQFQSLLDGIKDDAFRDLVEVLRHTGCRPEEARKLTASEFDRQQKCWKLPAGFTSKTKENRSIPLSDRANEICGKWAERFPSGPMFRNTDGNAWTKQALNSRCARLSRKLKFYVCPYAIRHTFATDAIVRGVDLVTIARIMGHADLSMLQKFYQHIQKRADHLRKGLEKAVSHLG